MTINENCSCHPKPKKVDWDPIWKELETWYQKSLRGNEGNSKYAILLSWEVKRKIQSLVEEQMKNG